MQEAGKALTKAEYQKEYVLVPSNASNWDIGYRKTTAVKGK